MRLRPGGSGDLRRCQEIERAAGDLFRAVGMAGVADHAPPTLEELEGYRAAGRLWVAEEPGGSPEPVAYLLAEPVDGRTHIEQVSVHPRAARQGIGRLLIDRAAAEGGGASLTLTTFRDVPWNAPYYARIGFAPLAEGELTPGLRAIRAREAELGLDRWPRLCMSRAARLSSAGSPPAPG
ncbi:MULTISPECIES: GNAT family N-acetyltransferase [unclassified Streptomyces]|uniref:GNAT family N-acetyltransferase n=1 Tax=unclassified Streptomyces TaxID=2593676 RepID=UPI0022B60EF3|nr:MULTISPECIES: GNAT family N-acetyltransferase [unclassified Streptomyces]MCZ7415599.1 GNAT family N-acetyltransferase [Streptomyces sp. WMMC897]MCZ7434589.1 GNAT family N-acetyltransferase [Streptomyces sp. WMMC1477]